MHEKRRSLYSFLYLIAWYTVSQNASLNVPLLMWFRCGYHKEDHPLLLAPGAKQKVFNPFLRENEDEMFQPKEFFVEFHHLIVEMTLPFCAPFCRPYSYL